MQAESSHIQRILPGGLAAFSQVGLDDERIGLLLTLTLLGDAIISLLLALYADTLGRKATLIASCVLMAGAGAVYAGTLQPTFWALLVAATLGVLSPSGNEVGPFMALEQSILSDLVRRGMAV